LGKTLPQIDLLLAAIILSGSKFNECASAAWLTGKTTTFRSGTNYKLADVESRPNPIEYEVCYAVMSDVPGDLHIPFFSKVVMKNAVKRLQAYGYKVTKKKIPIS
jgi:hypothetical protein